MFTKRKSLLLGFLAAATATGLALGVNDVVDAYVGEPVEVNAVSEDSDSITFNFTNKASIQSEGWASNPSNLSWNADNNGRGISLSKSDGALEYTLNKEFGVSSVSVTASANDPGYVLQIKNGSTVYGQADIEKDNNVVYTFDNCNYQPGDTVTLSWTKGSKSRSIMFKEISFTKVYETPDVESLTISGDFKTEYAEGETLDLTGMVVTANFSEGEPAVLSSSDYSVNLDGVPLKTTDTEFVVSYTYNQKEVTVSYPITVAPRTLQSIAVTKNPTKTSYVIGQTLDTTGIVVTGTYDSGDPADLTSECTFSPTTLDVAGEQAITVTHTPSGKTASFNVTVAERKVSRVSLTDKVDSFDAGQTFTLGDDAKLTAIWNDGSETPLSIDDEGVLVELFSDLSGVPGQGRKIDSSYVLTAEDDGLYVNISYGGESANKYQIFVRKVVDLSNGIFKKVNSNEDFAVGDSIIITATYEGQTYALSFNQTGNYQNVSEVTIKDGYIRLEPNGSVGVICLSQGINGEYALETSNGYLSANGGTKDNYLSIRDDINETSSWTINVVNGVASLTANASSTEDGLRNILKFNYNRGNPRFSCYKDTFDAGASIEIYKFVDNRDAVSEFVDTYMHMSLTANENKCYGPDGYYAKAKEALVKLTDEQIELFKTDSEFNDAHLRYLAWAAANGDSSPYSGEYVSPALSINNSDDLMEIAVISALAVAGIAAAGAFVFLRRKKEA